MPPHIAAMCCEYKSDDRMCVRRVAPYHRDFSGQYIENQKGAKQV